MYTPTAFAEDRLEAKHGLIRSYPLGMLIVPSVPSADLVPFALYPDEGEAGLGVLRAHVARANPAWQALAAGGDCLVAFQGPQAYVSPNWYPGKAANPKQVPTWNYAMVQVRGTARVVHDAAWLRRLLGDLTTVHEGALPQPWSIEDAPADFIDGLLKAIVGIEVPVAAISGKWKVSQNRSAADANGVAGGLRSVAGAPGAAAMAALVAERAPILKPD